MDEREELVAQLGKLADEFDRTLRRSMPIEWPDIELTMPQLKALASLLDGPLRMGDIAAQSAVSLSAATAMVDRLVEKGLVARAHDEHDRRVVVCKLTGQGRELLERFWKVREESIQKLARQMTDDELRTVVAAMRIMTDAAGRCSGESSG